MTRSQRSRVSARGDEQVEAGVAGEGRGEVGARVGRVAVAKAFVR